MPVIQNRKSYWSYERNNAVASMTSSLLNMFEISSVTGPHELSVRLGISDKTAWSSGSFFLIRHNGRDLLTIDDQMADLLMPVSIPVELTGKDDFSVSFYNGTLNTVEAASIIRVDKA